MNDKNLKYHQNSDVEVNTRKSYEIRINAIAAGSHLQLSDFEQSLDLMQSIHSDAIGAPKVLIYEMVPVF